MALRRFKSAESRSKADWDGWKSQVRYGRTLNWKFSNKEPAKLFENGGDVLPGSGVRENVGCSILDILSILQVSGGTEEKAFELV